MYELEDVLASSLLLPEVPASKRCKAMEAFNAVRVVDMILSKYIHSFEDLPNIL